MASLAELLRTAQAAAPGLSGQTIPNGLPGAAPSPLEGLLSTGLSGRPVSFGDLTGLGGGLGRLLGQPAGGIPGIPGIPGPGVGLGVPNLPRAQPTGDYADLPGKYGQLVHPQGAYGGMQLQQGAYQSLHQSGFDMGEILGGSFRTNAQQAQLYASDPNRFAAPGVSLHEYGLAIDVSAPYRDTPDFLQRVKPWLLSHGWYQERSDEPWHFSFGVFTPAPQRFGPEHSTQPPTMTSRPNRPTPTVPDSGRRHRRPRPSAYRSRI